VFQQIFLPLKSASVTEAAKADTDWPKTTTAKIIEALCIVPTPFLSAQKCGARMVYTIRNEHATYRLRGKLGLASAEVQEVFQVAGHRRSIALPDLLCEPHLDQRLVRNVALMGGDLDLLQKADGEPDRNRGCARLKVGQPNALGLAPIEICGRVFAFPMGALFGFAVEGGGNPTGLFS
jgi:hypothetical protein